MLRDNAQAPLTNEDIGVPSNDNPQGNRLSVYYM